jgi:hypothetical protein
LGLAWKPGADIVAIKEGFRLGRINDYGYFGPAYPPEKPDDVVRIALMGDSYVVGLYLFDEHHFRSILEDRLNQVTSRPIQVLNLGFRGASFERMHLYYELLGKKFTPDYVLYFLSTNSLNRTDRVTGPRLVARDDSLTIDYSFRSSEQYESIKRLGILRESGIYSLLRRCGFILGAEEAPRLLFSKFFGKFASAYYRLFPRARAGQRDEDVGHIENPGRKALNRAILREIAKVNYGGSPEHIIVCRDGLPGTFVDYIRENAITYFDPSSELEELSKSGIDSHYWEASQTVGHWNHHAHKVVGEFLAEKMRPLIENR